MPLGEKKFCRVNIDRCQMSQVALGEKLFMIQGHEVHRTVAERSWCQDLSISCPGWLHDLGNTGAKTKKGHHERFHWSRSVSLLPEA